MMHGREKSDSAIVAGKPMNKAVLTAAESVERRAGAKGNPSQQSTTGHRAGSTCHKRWSAYGEPQDQRLAVIHPRWEPYARIGHVRICAGGREVTRVPTAIRAHVGGGQSLALMSAGKTAPRAPNPTERP
jgi:hypothetical protein